VCFENFKNHATLLEASLKGRLRESERLRRQEEDAQQRIQNELATVTEELDRTVRSRENLVIDFSQAEADLKQMSTQLSLSEGRNETSVCKIKDLNARIQRLSVTLDDANEKFEQTEKELESTMATLSKEREENVFLRKQLASLEGSQEDHIIALASRDNFGLATKNMEEKQSALAKEVANIKKELKVSLANNATEAAVSELKQKVQSLENKNSENKSLLKRAQRKVDKMKSECKKRQDELEHQYLEVQAANIAKESVEDKYNTSELMVKKLHKEIELLVETNGKEIDTIKTKLATVEKQGADAQKKIQKNEKEAQKATEDLLRKEEEIESLKSSISLLEGRCTGLQEAYSDVTARNDSLEKQLKQAETEIVQVSMKSIATVLTEGNCPASELKPELDDVFAELESTRVDLNDARTRLSQLKKSLELAVSKLTTVRQVLQTTMKNASNYSSHGKGRLSNTLIGNGDVIDLANQVKNVNEALFEARNQASQELREATVYCYTLRKSVHEKTSEMIELRKAFMEEKKKLMAEMIDLDEMVGQMRDENKCLVQQQQLELDRSNALIDHLRGELAHSKLQPSGNGKGTELRTVNACRGGDDPTTARDNEAKEMNPTATQEDNANETDPVHADDEDDDNGSTDTGTDMANALNSKKQLAQSETNTSLRTSLVGALAALDVLKKKTKCHKKEQKAQRKSTEGKMKMLTTQREALVKSLESAILERDEALESNAALSKALQQAKVAFATLKKDVDRVEFSSAKERKINTVRGTSGETSGLQADPPSSSLRKYLDAPADATDKVIFVVSEEGSDNTHSDRVMSDLVRFASASSKNSSLESPSSVIPKRPDYPLGAPSLSETLASMYSDEMPSSRLGCTSSQYEHPTMPSSVSAVGGASRPFRFLDELPSSMPQSQFPRSPFPCRRGKLPMYDYEYEYKNEWNENITSKRMKSNSRNRSHDPNPITEALERICLFNNDGGDDDTSDVPAASDKNNNTSICIPRLRLNSENIFGEPGRGANDAQSRLDRVRWG